MSAPHVSEASLGAFGAPADAPDPLTQQQTALIRSFLVTTQHFFGGFARLFAPVSDPRHPAFITHPLPCILATGTLLFLLRLGARRQIQLLLRHNPPSAAKFQALFGVDDCPHGDTLDATFRRLQPSEVQEVVTATVETLIRKKVLYPYRLLNGYFLVAIDGTGMLTFSERHCPHCLTMSRHGHTIYYHPVLEAKTLSPPAHLPAPGQPLRRRPHLRVVRTIRLFCSNWPIPWPS
jgi:hypothetical protein